MGLPRISSPEVAVPHFFLVHRSMSVHAERAQAKDNKWGQYKVAQFTMEANTGDTASDAAQNIRRDPKRRGLGA